MYLTQTAEYALRAMAHLVVQGAGAAVRAQDLSEATGIPLPYLQKILRRLVVAGLLESQKGHGGGFVLAKPASAVRFADVLDAADYKPDPEGCAFGWGACDPDNPCPLHPAWSQLKRAYGEWAARTTLASVRPMTRATGARRRAKRSSA